MIFKSIIIILLCSLPTTFTIAKSKDEQSANTVAGKFEVTISETKIKPYELKLNGKVIHEGSYEYFKIENSYKDKLSSYIIAYGYEPIGAGRCQKIILLFDIGKYGFDKHYINHHGGIRCWDGSVSSSFKNNILKIKAGEKIFIYTDDRYGNKTIEKVTK